MLRAHYEEEMHRFKEAQVTALAEMEEKHQAMSEEAQHEKEEEKKLLMAVCVRFCDRLILKKRTKSFLNCKHFSFP